MDSPTPPPGWYPDPSGAPAQRYWDGVRWTANTQPLAQAAYAFQAGYAAEQKKDPTTLLVLGIIFGLLIPIVGAVFGIILLARGQVGPGLAVLACCGIGVIGALALYGY